MTRRVTSPEFIDWLNRQLDTYHWNDSQASILAGLNKGSISEIRRGINPGAKKCIAFARLFNRPEGEALRLAGHMGTECSTPSVDTARIQRFLDRLKRLPPDKQDRIMEAASLMVEIAEVVDRATVKEDVLPEPD